MPKSNRNPCDRCDHCKKWVNENNHTLGTLEGIVSPGLAISFTICGKCFEAKGLDADYWNKWSIDQSSSLA